jgi:hypothetical protein
MLREGLLDASPGVRDARQKLVRLSAHGEHLLPQLRQCWQATRAAADSLDRDLPTRSQRRWPRPSPHCKLNLLVSASTCARRNQQQQGDVMSIAQQIVSPVPTFRARLFSHPVVRIVLGVVAVMLPMMLTLMLSNRAQA